MKGLAIIRGIGRGLFGTRMVIATGFGHKGNHIMMGFGLHIQIHYYLQNFEMTCSEYTFQSPTYPCGLCIAPLLKEFECRVRMAVLISYIDDGTIIVQSDTWGKNLVKLKLAYKIVFELTQSMGLVLEHNKLEGFHFS
jgi:hypothetical protein